MSQSPYTVTNIPISGTPGGETFGAVYFTDSSKFLISNTSLRFKFVSTTGVYSGDIGPATPDDIRGIALVNRWIVQNGNDTICSNDSCMMKASGGETYQWTLNGNPIPGANLNVYYATQSGWYNCQISTDSINCGTAGTADTAWFGKRLTVLNTPNVSISPSNLAYLCSSGYSVLLTGSSGGTSQWYLNGSPITGATSNTYYATTTGYYNMVKTNLNGCADSSQIPTQVILSPTDASINPNGAQTLCDPANILLVATSGAESYSWLLNGIPITGETNDSINVSQTGVYSCVLTYGNCNDTTINSFDLTVIDCSGLNEEWIANLKIFPNPASEFVTIQSNLLGNWNISFLEITGKKVAQFNSSQSNQTINIKNFSKGIYIIQLTQGDFILNKRLIIH